MLFTCHSGMQRPLARCRKSLEGTAGATPLAWCDAVALLLRDIQSNRLMTSALNSLDGSPQEQDGTEPPALKARELRCC